MTDSASKSKSRRYKKRTRYLTPDKLGLEVPYHKGYEIGTMPDGVRRSEDGDDYLIVHSYSSECRRVDVRLGLCDCPSGHSQMCSHLFAATIAFPEYSYRISLLTSAWRELRRTNETRPAQLNRFLQTSQRLLKFVSNDDLMVTTLPFYAVIERCLAGGTL